MDLLHNPLDSLIYNEYNIEQQSLLSLTQFMDISIMVMGTDDAVQILVFKRVNNAADTATTQARTEASSIALAELNITTEPSSPSSLLTSAVNLLAAGLLAKEEVESKRFHERGMALLEKLRGDEDNDAEWSKIEFV